MKWTRVLDVDQVPAGAAKVVKPAAGLQIAVFRTARGELHAVDNRCPHEGYPLATGALKDGVLTCEWHNWKFRLCDGACLLGGENVRHYPLRIEDDGVWLDLAAPPADRLVPPLYESLDRALDELDWGHAARTVERLLAADESAETILGHACDWCANRERYGFDHGLATAADLAGLFEDFGDERDLPLLHAIAVMVEPNVRRPPREWPAPEPPRGDVETELRLRIEAEDREGAEALVRGAIEAGAEPREVFRWLTHAATDHFLDYAHAHIYVVKAEELLDRIGWDHAHPVLTCLVSSIVYGTREDRLPYMKQMRSEMLRFDEHLEPWSRAEGGDLDVDALLFAVLDGTLPQALAAVAGALDSGASPARVALALALAASHRLLRFDPAIEARDDVSEGWLHVTHLLTHADAVRESLLRRPSAEAVRGLLHSARFIQHLHVLDLPPGARPAIERASIDRSDYRRSLVSDRFTLPIFVAHHVKTGLAALRVGDALAADPQLGVRLDRELPLLATLRFLAHPVRERRILRRAKMARTFVQEGRMHTKLIGY
jgi:nitrite reductase/ring-hydroxylating ferredoxin subunit